MDPALAATVISTVGALLGVWLTTYKERKRNGRINAAIEGAPVSLTKASGEEQFIKFLKDDREEILARVKSLEQDRKTDRETIAAQAVEIIELRARTVGLELERAEDKTRIDELERVRDDSEDYIILLKGLYETDPSPLPREAPARPGRNHR